MVNNIIAINAVVFLLFFASIESKFPDQENKTKTTTASSDKILVSECFADFLILQFDLRGNGTHFVLNPKSKDIHRDKLRQFMVENEKKTVELWRCVNNASPQFPKIMGEGKSKQIDGEYERQNNYALLTNLMDIFRMKIAKLDTIAPSHHVQEKLHKAQCWLESGVIDGKVLMEKSENLANYVPSNKSELFKELKNTGKNPHIGISTEGAAHLVKCLQKRYIGIKFDKGSKEIFQLFGSVNRKELVKIISKLVTISEALLQEINIEIKQCLAELFVLHFRKPIDLKDREFVVHMNNFPGQDEIAGLDAEEMQPFVDCLTRRESPFKKFFANRKQINILLKDFYEHNNGEAIAISQVLRQKIYNAQCWLDLGAIEGKIKMEYTRIIENYSLGETVPWLKELDSDKPVVVSPEGADHLQGCLHTGKGFEAKLEKMTERHQWHVQLLNPSEQQNLLKLMKRIPFSLWLYDEFGWEQSCVAEFLIKEEFAHTTLDPTHPERRMIVWNDNMGKWPTKVHADSHPDNFGKLSSCIFRKSTLLKMEFRKSTLLKIDIGGKQYIDLEPLFTLSGGHIYVNTELKEELEIQSDCLAKFLTIKAGNGDGKCLLKKRRAPSGYFIFEVNNKDPFRPYIVNFGNSARAYALSAENCHLPEGETGVYSEGSEEFEQLWDCVVQMTTDVEKGKKVIDVKNLLKMHIPEQLYLHGYPVEFFPTIEPTMLGDDKICVICQEEYGHNDDDRIVALPCKHKYHSNCLQKWIKMQDRCPLCSKELLEHVPVDPMES